MCKRTSCVQIHELPQRHCGDNRDGTLFSWLHVYYAHIATVRFEYPVCRGLLMITYIMLLPWLVENSLVNWYQQCVTVHHVPRCLSCHKIIVMITERAHCFHDYMYLCVYISVITTVALWCGNSCIWTQDGRLEVHHVSECMW